MTNLFGGIIAFLNISGDMELSISQVTLISMMILVAHTYAFGFVIFKIYQLGGWYNEPAVLPGALVSCLMILPVT